METAELKVNEARKRERQAVKKMQAMSKTLETMKQLLRDVRVSRDQYRHQADKATKSERKALRSVVTAQKRAATAEQQKTETYKREQEATMKTLLQDLSSAVQPVPEKRKKFATHAWLAVARVLGIEGKDLKRIAKASKHMHDTKSRNWEESVKKNTELIIRLRSVGKILTTCLFACVRIKGNTVPIEEVVRVIFPISDNDINGGKALQEIRKAVHSAVSERRMSDARMLLTLSISSFGAKGGTLTAMKKYFTHIEPILIGSKVTFLTPDKSPINTTKKIDCRNYSYLSKVVTRGTVVSMMTNGKEIKVRHHVPGVCACPHSLTHSQTLTINATRRRRSSHNQGALDTGA